MTSGFNSVNFNNLPSLVEARKQLECELRGLNFEKHFLLSEDIRRLFLDGAEARQFGIFIAHRRAQLKEGERMISTPVRRDLPRQEPQYGFHSIIQPRLTKGQDSIRIVPSSWVLFGGHFQEFEYKELEDDLPDRYLSPSSQFLQTFQDICVRFGITVLGIFSLGLTHSAVNDDNVFLREDYNQLELRSQTARLIKRSDLEDDMISSAWIPGLAKEVWHVGTVEDVSILDFSYESYNKLRPVMNANIELRRQMESNGIKKFSDLFVQCPDFRKLFLEGPDIGRYGIALAHRHHVLEEGERMVMTLQPSQMDFVTVSAPRRSKNDLDSEQSERIVAVSWMLVNGRFEEFEHKAISSYAIDRLGRYMPPPPRFLREFRRICKAHQVDMLGLFSRELPYGWNGIQSIMDIPIKGLTHVFLETTISHTREQKIRHVPRTSLDLSTTSRSAWIFMRVAEAKQASIKEAEQRACALEDLDLESTNSTIRRLESEAMDTKDPEQLGRVESELKRVRMKQVRKLFMRGSEFHILPPINRDSSSISYIDMLCTDYDCQQHGEGNLVV